MLKRIALLAIVGGVVGIAQADNPPVIFIVSGSSVANGHTYGSFLSPVTEKFFARTTTGPLHGVWNLADNGFDGDIAMNSSMTMTVSDGVCIATTANGITFHHLGGWPFVLVHENSSYGIQAFVKGPSGTPYVSTIDSSFGFAGDPADTNWNEFGSVMTGGWFYLFGGPGHNHYVDQWFGGSQREIVYNGEIYSQVMVNPGGGSAMAYGNTGPTQLAFTFNATSGSTTVMKVRSLASPQSTLRMIKVTDTDPDNPKISVMPLEPMNRITWLFNGVPGEITGTFKTGHEYSFTVPGVASGPAGVNMLTVRGYDSSGLLTQNTTTLDESVDSYTTTAAYTAKQKKSDREGNWSATVGFHRRAWGVPGGEHDMLIDSITYSASSNAPLIDGSGHAIKFLSGVTGAMNHCLGTNISVLPGANTSDGGVFGWTGSWTLAATFAKSGLSTFTLKLSVQEGGTNWKFNPGPTAHGILQFVVPPL